MSIPMGGGYAPATGRVDFGWIGSAWTLLTAQLGTWIGATLLCGVVSLLVWLLAAIPTGILRMIQQTYAAVIAGRTPPSTQAGTFLQFTETHLLAIVVGGVGAVLYAGLSWTALRQIRGEPISAVGVFSALPKALPLLALGVIAPLVTTAIEGASLGLLHFTPIPPAVAASLASLVSWLPGVVIPGLLMFASLLVLDRGAGILEAITGSLALLKGQWVMGVLFYFVATLLSGLGAIACGVGMLFTFPLFIISIAVGYQSLTQPPLPVSYSPYASSPPADPGVWPPPPAAS